MRTRARRRGGDWVIDGAKHVDHERRAGGRRHRMGGDRRRHQRVPGREGDERVRRRASSRTSCRCARRARPSSRSTDVSVPESARLPDAERVEGRAALPRRGAVRDCVGRLRRRARRASIRCCDYTRVARAVRSAAEPHAADPDAARGRRAQAHRRATARVAPREAQGARRCHERAGLAREVEQRARWRSTLRAIVATCSGRPASRSITARCGTC